THFTTPRPGSISALSIRSQSASQTSEARSSQTSEAGRSIPPSQSTEAGKPVSPSQTNEGHRVALGSQADVPPVSEPAISVSPVSLVPPLTSSVPGAAHPSSSSSAAPTSPQAPKVASSSLPPKKSR